MKITKEILQNIIKEELDAVLKDSNKIEKAREDLSACRSLLGKVRSELYGEPGTKHAYANISSVIAMLFVVSDMLRGRYNKDNAKKYGLQLPSDDDSVTNRVFEENIEHTK